MVPNPDGMESYRETDQTATASSCPSVPPTTPTEKGFCASGAKLPGTFCLNRNVIMRSVLARGPILRCMMHADRPTAGIGDRGRLAFRAV